MRLQIGEVAAIFRVSKDTLRYYDKEGLLKVKRDPENGYRYYTVEDVELLDYILFLRSLDVPIAEMKQLIQQSSMSKMQDVLEQKQQKLNEEIQRLQRLQTRVTEQLTIMNEFSNVKEYEVSAMPIFNVEWHSFHNNGFKTKEELLHLSEIYNDVSCNKARIVLKLERKEEWEITEWAIIHPTDMKFHDERVQCVTGYVSGVYDELSKEILHLEQRCDEQNVSISDTLFLIESFFTVENGKGKTFSRFYLPIESID